MNQDDKFLRTLRTMAWQRAKGEINAMLNTYWKEDDKHTQLRALFIDFVSNVESEGLQE